MADFNISKPTETGPRGLKPSRAGYRFKAPATSLAIVASAIAIIGVTLYVTANRPRSALATPVERSVNTLLSGIPQNGDALGSPAAPITLQVFGDLECASVKEWFESRLPAILSEFVRTRAVRIEYREMKTDTINPETFVNQQSAAIAAGRQARMWTFLVTFYLEQGREYSDYVTESFLDHIAQQVPGLDAAIWHRDRTGALANTVIVSNRAARKDGLHDTPGFRIGRTGGPMRNLEGHTAIIYPSFTYRIHADGTTSLIPISGRHMHPFFMVDTQDLRKAVEKLKQ